MRTLAKAWLSVALIWTACGSDAGNDMTGAPGAMPSTQPPAAVGMAGAGAVAMQPTMAPTPTQTTPTTPTTPAQMPPTQPTTPTQPAQMMPTTMDPPAMMPSSTDGLALDECGLDTGFAGDQYCIKPPPADKGFQVHLGPADYKNPSPEWVMEPGTETTVQLSSTSGNDQDVYYYWRQYRMRPGSHHWIVTANGKRIGGTQNLAKDTPDKGIIAPENEGVGMKLAAHAQLGHSLHYYNFGDKPMIKEVWMNVWYRDAKDVTEPALEVFSMLGMGIAPGEHVIKHGACTVNGTGRMLTLYGHVHAHNQRFSAWRTRGGQKTLIHEQYDWEHPTVSEYSSIEMNPALDPANKVDGGYSGVLDLKPGDVIEFECDILNDTNNVFVGQNEAQDDEMCIMVGDSAGTQVPGFCTATNLPATN
jgi:hypothetical protein